MKRFLAPILFVIVSACTSHPQNVPHCNCSSIGGIAPLDELIPGAYDRVYFNTGSAEIISTSPNATILKQQIVWLNEHPRQNVQIAGNTDERGTNSYNFALGQRRAEAVRAYLIAGGIDPERIKIISYGKERPILKGHDQSAWKQNRVAITSLQGYDPQFDNDQ